MSRRRPSRPKGRRTRAESEKKSTKQEVSTKKQLDRGKCFAKLRKRRRHDLFHDFGAGLMARVPGRVQLRRGEAGGGGGGCGQGAGREGSSGRNQPAVGTTRWCMLNGVY